MNFRRLNYFILINILISIRLNGQNLVVNPGFETYTICPAGNSGISNGFAPPWGTPPGSIITPDLCNTCCLNIGNCISCVNVPDNFMGTAPTQSGNGYSSVLTMYDFCPNCKEYITQQFSTPLVGGLTYKVEAYFRPGDYNKYLTDCQGLYVSTIPPPQPGGNQPITTVIPQVVSTSIISDTSQWTLVTGNYVATGGEQYVTIGCFLDNANTAFQTVSYPGGSTILVTGGAMYMIDDVYVGLTTPLLNITGDTIICLGDSDTLFAHGGNSYQWANALNASVIIGTDSILIVSPSTTTTYFVYGTNDTTTITIQVINPPILNLGNDTSICPGTTMQLNATIAGATYLWQDASTNATFSVVDSGNYYVQVSIGSCIATDTIIISYLGSPVFSLGNDTALCPNQTFTINLTGSGASYLWQDGNVNPLYTFSNAGLFWCEISNGTCTLRDTINITNVNPPQINLGNDTTLCIGASLLLDATIINGNYLWQDGSVNSTFNVISSGVYFVTINNGCTASDTIIVSYLQPIPIFGNDTSICDNAILTLSALTLGATYLWQDASINSNYTVTNSGTYWVNISVSGCQNSDTIIISTIPSPVFSLGNDTAFCDGNSILLNPIVSNANYFWSNSSSTDSFIVSSAGIYSVTITANGCSSADTVSVLLNTLPVSDLGYDLTICEDTVISLSAGTNPTYNFLWNTNEISSVITVNETGVYWVRISNVCGSVTDSIILLPKPCGTDSFCDLYFPNAFTPNGDGINDLFYPNDICKTEYIHLFVYNRWGELIYFTDLFNDGWNGTRDDVPCSMGVYIYVCRYRIIDASQANEIKTGNVTLIR